MALALNVLVALCLDHNRPPEDAINAKNRRGIEQLDHGESIPEHELDAYLVKLKASRE